MNLEMCDSRFRDGSGSIAGASATVAAGVGSIWNVAVPMTAKDLTPATQDVRTRPERKRKWRWNKLVAVHCCFLLVSTI